MSKITDDAPRMLGAAPQADTEELWRRIAFSFLIAMSTIICAITAFCMPIAASGGWRRHSLSIRFQIVFEN
jgi:hypothetical protein